MTDLSPPFIYYCGLINYIKHKSSKKYNFSITIYTMKEKFLVTNFFLKNVQNCMNFLSKVLNSSYFHHEGKFFGHKLLYKKRPELYEYSINGFEFQLRVTNPEKGASKVRPKSAEKSNFSSSIFTMKERFLVPNFFIKNVQNCMNFPSVVLNFC